VIQQLLLLGQVLVVVLIYLFVWRVMRAARHDMLRGPLQASASSAPQDSTIIPPAEIEQARRKSGLGDPRVVVVSSETLRPGIPFVIGRGLSMGRAPDNDIVLDDSFVSGHHARLTPPATLVDLGSTNGTLHNGRAATRASLRPGDEFQVGTTVFRYEVPS
jgi:pSer/pThr/pTyr-binding forkhead associated (FHA) protein